jgi:oxygen-independent coproporphyrinogen III oxidase
LEALIIELKQRKQYLADKSIQTIYFGGGTPSLLLINEVNDLLGVINDNFFIEKDSEITFEVNPEDITPEYARGLRKIGVNRLSIGVQSFNPNDLAYLGRIHTTAQADKAVIHAKESGFDNITIDLIYGIPGQVLATWIKNLEKTEKLGIPHLSAYSLTTEPKTILSYQVRKHQKKPADDELVRMQFFELLAFAKQNGFNQYEISNFAKEGYISRHNSGYWRDEPYLGIGPSAHSYNRSSRQWNRAVNSEYIRKVNTSEPGYEFEDLSKEDKLNEYLMLSLRTLWGTDLNKLNSMSDAGEFEKLHKKIINYIKSGHLSAQKEDKIILTFEGMMISDSIISDLFIT